MNLEIKLATQDNLDELLPIICAYHKFEGIDLTEKEREKSVKKLISDRSLGGIWLISVDVEIVGYIALCTGYSIEFAGLDAFVDEFYIHPKSRGKGIGTKTLELVKVEAKKMGVQAIHLEVAHTNIKAKNLYSKVGFTTREKYVLMSVNL